MEEWGRRCWKHWRESRVESDTRYEMLSKQMDLIGVAKRTECGTLNEESRKERTRDYCWRPSRRAR